MNLRTAWRDRRHGILLRLARRGHEDSFTRLYQELYGPVTAFVTGRVRNREDAEDLVSQVFQRFLAGMDRFDGRRGSVLGWTLALARHAVIDRARRQAAHGGARRSVGDVDGMAEILPSPVPDALAALVADEDLARLAQLLEMQPPEIREMFELRFGQGLALKDVAVVLDLSEDAVKQRFARATRKLREQWQGDVNPAGKGGKACTATD